MRCLRSTSRPQVYVLDLLKQMTNPKLNTEEMERLGVQVGHKVSKLHPKMKSFVAGIKNGVHAFDLDKTAKELEKALSFVSKLIADGKSIVFIGTKIQHFFTC